MTNLKIGEHIRLRRKAQGLTQEQLANLLGVTKAAVSKWENEESYPDITLLPQIAQLFQISLDALLNSPQEDKPFKDLYEYHFGFSWDDVDSRILNYGIAKECAVCKNDQNEWEVRIHFTSTTNDAPIPYILQKHIKPGVLIDGYCVRLENGKAMDVDDDQPNKFYVCKEKIWAYNCKDQKYLKSMLQEQVAMGLIEDDLL
ncbi:MAG: helix-turn-helix transcriptional regulator [Clostridia bacterium]|nr:helix-turn-helix transcriptional regulator [Clostridia bacterium]